MFKIIKTKGSEPHDRTMNSLAHWQRTIQGHAAANMTPIATTNRIGADGLLAFYGHSFICDETGDIVVDAADANPAVISAQFDLAAIARRRAAWGLFRDLRTTEITFFIYKKCKNTKNILKQNFLNII